MSRFVALLFALCASFPAHCAVPTGAMQAVEAYSASFNSYDCEALVSRMSPRVRLNIEKMSNGKNTLCLVIEAFKAEGVRERLRAPTASLSHGQYRMVLVPSIRTGVEPVSGRPSMSDGIYVVHSSDSGRTWSVLDLGCLDGKLVKAVYPPYNGTPSVSAATQRFLTQREMPSLKKLLPSS